jgi:hypothetical protein
VRARLGLAGRIIRLSIHQATERRARWPGGNEASEGDECAAWSTDGSEMPPGDADVRRPRATMLASSPSTTVGAVSMPPPMASVVTVAPTMSAVSRGRPKNGPAC